MIRKLMFAAAVSGLALSTAWAQAPSPSPSPSQTPSATQPAPEKSPSSSSAMNGGTPKVVASQQPDQLLWSKFKGTNVVDKQNQKIGDVSDILFDKDGKIQALVVGVGGFLGIGSKDVALSMSSFQMVPGKQANTQQLQLAMTKDQLKQAATFKAYTPPTTTGSGSSTRRPAGGGMGR